MLYAITDIETTGGNPVREKITEIAIYVFDGHKIVDQLVTLVNPEKYIPAQIQQLTGITNEMVKDAPKFYEIARRIVELTEDCTFVAHNVTFDYNFVRAEFKALGYDFQRPYLCTVKLSRKLLPGFPSYSLGILSANLNIEIKDRHRASGDALATVELFKRLQAEAGGCDMADIELAEILKGLHQNLDKNLLKTLPEETGVYYFMDENHLPLYVGKSINIRKRVYSHFSNKSVKSAEIKSNTCFIDFELTGSELVALLYEASEVKHHKPMYNKQLRRTAFSWGLYSYDDQMGYINLELRRNTSKSGIPFMLFANKKEAENFLHKQIEKYSLCQNLCSIYKSSNGCFHYQIGMCNGACVGKESPELYNRRVAQLIEATNIPDGNYFIIDAGRNAHEKSIVKIENGMYKGFGYIDVSCADNMDDLHESIVKQDDNKDVRSIISSFITRKKYEKLLYY